MNWIKLIFLIAIWVISGITLLIVSQLYRMFTNRKTSDDVKVKVIKLGSQFTWTIYQDGKAVQTGTAESLELAMADAYGAVSLRKDINTHIYG